MRDWDVIDPPTRCQALVTSVEVSEVSAHGRNGVLWAWSDRSELSYRYERLRFSSLRLLISRVLKFRLWVALVSISLVVMGPACAQHSAVDPPLDIAVEDADASVISSDADVSKPLDAALLDAGTDLVPTDTSSEDVAPDAQADAISCHTYESSVQVIFNQSCVTCHESGSDNNGVNLMPGESLNSLLNDVSAHGPTLIFVVPGDAEASFLIEKMNPNPSYGVVMPRNGVNSGVPLSLEKRQLVADWINAGADLAPFGCVSDGGP